MTSWTIEPIPLHRVRVPGPEVLFQRAFEERIELAIYAFLLRSGDRVCLVDTGLGPDYRTLNQDIRARKGADSGFIDVAAPLVERLRDRELVPEAVLLTSFGPYATGGLDAIGRATLFVSARGCADLEQPEEPALAHALAPALHERLLRARRVTREQEVLPGLVLLESGVHHPASATVLVQTADGVIAIADPVFVARNLVQGTALGAAEHVAQWHRMVRDLGRRCDALIPIHDPDPTPVARDRWHASLAASAP